ncbi:4-(cytidine 5'-diphospho)-2-C-methyl-D-erythritol kinase [Leucobacter weissii]|uniref:4-diphosphocytidyl-2-C-methyl-D-erythritol kinase n=1 Tax=Leucobacter weissii TaxID=1983706 RepID=A0A939S727_9MICO|nr:4-(cytidine 5'-diphospho)-2-C-methyl-D-erythritol kinase [Leucobacter weissii]MBO1902994.1 4-(cytidine 5'-diphospho)-2-C-methyl-D-erythritol kinase [Leucobacter weissii]
MGGRRGFGSVTARAPGKINVLLRVGALQPDGYHDVASLYQAVSLCEEVTAEHAEGFSVRFGGPIDCSGLSVDDSNLAIRAARLLAAETGHPGGAALSVVKQVPIAGGMGGGSADAAAALVACDELWGTGLGRSGLLPLASRLGADVPFALAGGTAIGVGRGDQLSPALAKGEFHWVLAFSDAGLSTPEVYAALDRHRERHRSDLPPVRQRVEVDPAAIQAVRSGDRVALAEVLHNDLQPAALRLAPHLGEVLELGESHGALAGIVSGSGPTCAFLVPHALAAAELVSAFAREGISAVTATGPARGARITRAE